MYHPFSPVLVEPVTLAKRSFVDDLVRGLHATPKRIESKYFYDAVGADLFEKICELPEYYPTRTEIGILARYLPEMAAIIGPRAMVVEFGSGAGTKTRMLIDALADVAVYVPIDISKEQLLESSRLLERDHPGLEVHPLAQDYTRPIVLPESSSTYDRVLIFFPGSTIGNFEPEEALRFLRTSRKLAGHDGGILIGVDLVKDSEVLDRAYNDAQGVTAAFNLHLIERMRDELGVRISPDDFEHYAFYNSAEARIEMHLVSRRDQAFEVGSSIVRLDEGEHIVTEYSHKYSVEGFRELVGGACLSVEHVWLDPQSWFGVFYLVAS